MDYLVAEDHEELGRAKTYEDLLAVAIRVVDRIPRPTGVVCGPITSGGHGSVEANIAEFERRIARLESQGRNIFSQMSFEMHMWRVIKTTYGEGDANLLDIFYGSLFRSGRISEFYFIPGWESSRGATWEHDLVTQLGSKIAYLI